MPKKAGIIALALILGAGSSLAAAACGEDRGSVRFEGGTATGGETAGTTAETAPPTTPTTTVH